MLGAQQAQAVSEVEAETCPVVATARVISGKWTLLILRDLAEGPCRFSQIERSLAGISPRTLSLRLRALEEEGIVERREHRDALPRADYRLTDRGRDLLPVIEAMRDYGTRWQMTECDPQ
jgi:DNA-binding HxlR family transcriptional regulator